MFYKSKTVSQLFLTISISIASIFFLFFALTIIQPIEKVQAAQPPPRNGWEFLVQAANPLSADMEIFQRTSNVTITAGSQITFTISITNLGPNVVSYTLFYDNFPTELQNRSFSFSNDSAFMMNSNNDKEWLIYKPVAINSPIFVTVTGILTSTSRNISVTNTVAITPVGFHKDYNTGNNISSLSVSIFNSSAINIFLPVIFKNPAPPPTTLAYYENFNAGKPWFEFNSGGCNARNTNNQYWVDLDKSKVCFPPAKNENKPETPYRVYGEFEVSAYISGDVDGGGGNPAYGLFINGSGGGQYYLLRVWPNESACSNGGAWDLIRRQSNVETKIMPRVCNSVIKTGLGASNANVIKLVHKTDKTLSVYINSIFMKTYTDPTQLTSTGTGLFVDSTSTKRTRIKFDDFKVYKFQ